MRYWWLYIQGKEWVVYINISHFFGNKPRLIVMLLVLLMHLWVALLQRTLWKAGPNIYNPFVAQAHDILKIRQDHEEGIIKSLDKFVNERCRILGGGEALKGLSPHAKLARRWGARFGRFIYKTMLSALPFHLSSIKYRVFISTFEVWRWCQPGRLWPADACPFPAASVDQLTDQAESNCSICRSERAPR